MRTAALVLAGICVSTAAFANDSPYEKNHMEPFGSERLSSPISLTGNCANVVIVEWRPTPGRQVSTSPSDKAKTAINETCELVVKNFKRFVLLQQYTVGSVNNFSQTISLMPADIQNHGSDLRNLNDFSYRFNSRYKELDEDGDVIPIWGYHSRSTSHIYIRNDALSSNFKTVFAHELFHAMSYQFGIFQQYSSNQTATDEKMARKFTQFIGLGE